MGLWVPWPAGIGRQEDLWGAREGPRAGEWPQRHVDGALAREHMATPLGTSGAGGAGPFASGLRSCAECLCTSPSPLWASVSWSVPVAEGRLCCLGSSRKGRALPASSPESRLPVLPSKGTRRLEARCHSPTPRSLGDLTGMAKPSLVSAKWSRTYPAALPACPWLPAR